MNRVFLLDMDGVCCDWTKKALQTLNCPQYIDNWTNGVKSVSQITGYSYDYIWDKIDKFGSKWWEDLEEFPWFWDMYNYLKSEGDVVFCTKPSLDSNSLKGKVDWMQKRFGKKFINYSLTPLKHLNANKNHILIDDTEKQINKFIKEGGRAILFPQYWNSLHTNKEALENRLDYLKDKVRGLD